MAMVGTILILEVIWIGGWKKKDDNNGNIYQPESLANIKFSKLSCIALNIDTTLPSNDEILLFSKNPQNYEATYLNGKLRRLPHIYYHQRLYLCYRSK